jgi:ABC-type nickel/cobalt efflux system permease component RcnA
VRLAGRDMSSLLALVVLGFFLGMRHATDPDHVVAVTTIVARHRQRGGAALIGALWGAGHTLTILVVGAGIILLGWVIPPRLGLSLELCVGVMLIVLGVLNLSGGLRRVAESATPATGGGHDHSPVHVHPHPHGDYIHTHVHGHDPESHPHSPDETPLARLDRWFGALGAYQSARPLVVGIVHGLAGSAAVALLVLTTIRDPGWSILYLLVFGAGTVAGMMLITVAIAWPFSRAGARSGRLQTGLRVASGVVSLAFGIVLAYRIGVVDGLFGATPTWTPK